MAAFPLLALATLQYYHLTFYIFSYLFMVGLSPTIIPPVIH